LMRPSRAKYANERAMLTLGYDHVSYIGITWIESLF
jgi:hypothetical protein